LGHGFTSSAWYAQSDTQFWAGNVPLHSALLYLWMKAFGFSITAVRSINFAYFAASILLLWRASIRLNLLKSSWLRLALFGLLTGGYSMVFAYRSGRPDCLAMLLICGSVYVHSRRCWRQRIFGGAALGFLMPWAGLQLLPMLAVGGALLWLYLGRAVFLELLATAAGVGIGGISLAWFYVAHGVWPQFLLSVRQHTTIGFFGWLGKGELRHSNLVPKDFSFMVLFLLAVLLAVRWLRKGNLKSPLSFGLVYSVTLTIALIFSGKFPTYYGWMTYVPLSLCLCMILDQLPPAQIWRRVGGIFLTGAVVVSLGLHGITALSDWTDRDYANVEKLLRENVTADDWVYGDFSTYYAAKKTAARVFLPLYLSAFAEGEKERVTVLVVSPRNLEEATHAIGGEWVTTGKGFTPSRNGFWASRRNMGFLSTLNYDLKVYRRVK
ncbi:MAG TPA: hypothetical protein VK815_17255, partial [Candidatus Acidoferrales bacterium]|nr:hypothetical protein [Candidatus Acidoferrales bacterium]